MENTVWLKKFKQFKNEVYFFEHIEKLLTILYPQQKVEESSLHFEEDNLKEVDVVFKNNAIHLTLSDSFKKNNQKFLKDGHYDFKDIISAQMSWTGSSGLCYVYPLDRNEFEDSRLGMEQRAASFVIIMQVVIQFLKTY